MQLFIERDVDSEMLRACLWSMSIEVEMHILPVLGSNDIKCWSNRAS